VPEKPEPNSALLTLYAVQNKDGKWFRAKGYGGGGKTWVDELNGAKIYAKIGQARAQVTYFAKNHPSFGIPNLVALDVISARVLVDEIPRAKKAVDKSKKRDEKHAQYAESYRRRVIDL
jgi:hypothetical protein